MQQNAFYNCSKRNGNVGSVCVLQTNPGPSYCPGSGTKEPVKKKAFLITSTKEVMFSVWYVGLLAGLC